MAHLKISHKKMSHSKIQLTLFILFERFRLPLQSDVGLDVPAAGGLKFSMAHKNLPVGTSWGNCQLRQVPVGGSAIRVRCQLGEVPFGEVPLCSILLTG